MKSAGKSPFRAVLEIKAEELALPGKEFDVAVALKRSYGLSVIQLHDVVAWLKGRMSNEDLERALGEAG